MSSLVVFAKLISRVTASSPGPRSEAKTLMKKMFRVSQRQCNTGDTVPVQIDKPRAVPTGSKSKVNLE